VLPSSTAAGSDQAAAVSARPRAVAMVSYAHRRMAAEAELCVGAHLGMRGGQIPGSPPAAPPAPPAQVILLHACLPPLTGRPAALPVACGDSNAWSTARAMCVTMADEAPARRPRLPRVAYRPMVTMIFGFDQRPT